MPMSRGALRVAACLALTAWGPSAQAAKPTKRECASASEDGQDLRRAGRLREARALLAQCTAAACPGPIRKDCARLITQIEAVWPRLVFAAKDADGNDLAAVRVTVDGEPLVDRLDGTSVAVDPGQHRFGFEADGFRDAARDVLVREGDAGRQVAVVLQPLTPVQPVASASPKFSTPAEPPSPVSPSSVTSPASRASDGRGTQRAIGIASGASGLAALAVGGVYALMAKTTYDRARTDECGGDPNRCSPQGAIDGRTAHDEATVSTVTTLAGAVLLVGGGLLYFTAPSPPPFTVGAALAPGGAGVSVRALW